MLQEVHVEDTDVGGTMDYIDGVNPKSGFVNVPLTFSMLSERTLMNSSQRWSQWTELRDQPDSRRSSYHICNAIHHTGC